MVSAITQALLQRTATVRKIIQQTQGDDPNSAQTIALFDERSKQSIDAINKLELAKVDVKKQTKEIAAQKLARLKEQLRMLRMFGGSSKAMARQAAALAREIASAVSSYASAATDGASPIDDSKLAYSGGDASTSGGDDRSATNTANAGGEAAVATAEAAAPGSTDAAAATTGGATQSDAQATATTPSTPTATTDRAGVLAQRAADREQDRAFFQEAKNMLAQLRGIIEDAKHKDHAKHAKGSPAVFVAALNTVSSVDRSVASAERSVLAVPVVPVAIPAVRISV
ncbi:hypothetical protein [Roseiterribacter gracilis]|uniref:Uncharacterized protein n=1 Tax=Roseiterribacter gracilis TaxID=2812848 RepID=A0A8S8X7W1_9PROT|nr:hypothetical protein TMPK1_16800 [Rhodospirillales bacterium TMPK1]